MKHAIPITLLLVLSAAVHGEPLPPAPPKYMPAPLLFVRFLGPAGMHVTFYQGLPTGRDFPVPVTVGLRPGYFYRLKVSGLPEHPEREFYPTLEVRGTLQLQAQLRAEDHPAPLVLDATDFDPLLAGSFLTKVVYLEHPDRAVPAQADRDRPFEMEVPPTTDPIEEARLHGRPLLILRLGSRTMRADDLARQSVPGTVLAPGERVLPMPACPPQFSWACVPVIDPIAGARPPEEECLHDGGDIGQPAGIGPDGRLHGLDPSDSVAEYAGCDGRRRVVCSNRICLCVPRFAVVRTELPLVRHQTVVQVRGNELVQGQVQVQAKVPSVLAQQNEKLKGTTGRTRASMNVATQGIDRLVLLEVLNAYVLDIGPAALIDTEGVAKLTVEQRTRLKRQIELARELSQPLHTQDVESVKGTTVVGRVEGLEVIRAMAETRDLTCCCNEPPHPPERPLVLCKWASAQSAQVGDVVTFYLKYTNHGGQPITDVAVSDSLTGRLEYVPGSSKADRGAVFTTQENEAGSVILRWEIDGRLLPGQTGVVSFQAKVR